VRTGHKSTVRYSAFTMDDCTYDPEILARLPPSAREVLLFWQDVGSRSSEKCAATSEGLGGAPPTRAGGAACRQTAAEPERAIHKE
jgi:hypothetical protein